MSKTKLLKCNVHGKTEFIYSKYEDKYICRKCALEIFLKRKLEFKEKQNVSNNQIKETLIKNVLNSNLSEYTVKEFIKDAVKLNCVKTKIAALKNVKVTDLEKWCVKNNIPVKKQELIEFINKLQRKKKKI